MAKNFVCDGKVMDYTNGGETAFASGAVVVIGDTVGIAVTAIAAGKTGAVEIEGVFTLPKAANTALVQGEHAFWNTDTKLVVAAAGTDIVPLGRVYNKPGNAATVQVKINV